MDMMRGWWLTLLLVILVVGVCGMAMYVTGQDNACGGQIDWIGRCHS